jgi:23S rRNA (cytosine1962-C5)-methyltransferase
LNLFGYRGASTLAMVSAGLGVAHVDAARPNVQACRRAAELNGWADAPIRYLVDDAVKFVAREVRRGRRYSLIVLDPPAYGHSPRGRAWRLERDLWPLLDLCLELLEDPFSLLVTGHSPQVDQTDVGEFLRCHEKLQSRWQRPGLNLSTGRSQLRDRRGRRLDAGFYVQLGSHPSRDRSTSAG